MKFSRKIGDWILALHLICIVVVGIMAPRWCAMVAGCWLLHSLIWDKYYKRRLFIEL